MKKERKKSNKNIEAVFLLWDKKNTKCVGLKNVYVSWNCCIKSWEMLSLSGRRRSKKSDMWIILACTQGESTAHAFVASCKYIQAIKSISYVFVCTEMVFLFCKMNINLLLFLLLQMNTLYKASHHTTLNATQACLHLQTMMQTHSHAHRTYMYILRFYAFFPSQRLRRRRHHSIYCVLLMLFHFFA